jgi:hypothetical protein
VTFCSNDICATRLRVAFYLPDDDKQLSPPCGQCIRALADLLNVSATSMEEIKARVRAVKTDA